MNIQRFYKYMAICLVVCINACADKEQPSQNKGKLNLNAAETKESPPINDSIVSVQYLSATAYAAATDYVFEDQSGESIMIRWSYNDSLAFKIPNNMLESTDTLEGIPGPNPKLLAKYFELVYEAGVLKEIRLAK